MDREQAIQMLQEERVEEWNVYREKHPDFEPRLAGADLRDRVLTGVDLSLADLSGANLSEADLSLADLGGANLSVADLSRANLFRAYLHEADLSRAKLFWAHLSEADLTSARLYGADLRSANLVLAVFRETDLTEARFGGAVLADTIIDTPYLLGALELDQARHEGPSSVTVGSLLAFRDELPEEFLRGCGLRNEEIDYFRSVAGAPIRFYKCFISYSTKDEAFASQLHPDFQGAGIRCWKWNLDAKTGEDLYRNITDAIRVHDKVVLIVSESSLQSPAVDREVELALQEEDRRSKLTAEGKWEGVTSVLFPVRLDNYIFATDGAGNPLWDHPRRADVLRKMIADARGWHEDTDTYNQVLQRLIRDLKAEGSDSTGEPSK